MRKEGTQAQRNPFPYSDSNKRYYTYDYYLRQTFGRKVAKIPLDAGFTCPNIDGTCGVGGCIFCSGRGSGDFAQPPSLPLREQYERTRENLSAKWSVEQCIPYFQAHTNTYAPLSVLREKFEEAIRFPGAVGLNIATRADCIPDQTAAYLADLSERTVLTVELGLQSVHDVTALRIHRGHTYSDFLAGYERLRGAGGRIGICIHVILGLPGEDAEMMEQTAREVARLHPEQVKIHLLHVLRGTPLAALYEAGEYIPLRKEEYVRLAARFLELLPSDVVIARLTGDGMAADLLAPEWSRKKTSVVNDIDRLLYETDSYQGKNYR